ncbi:MAG: DNA polymerase III subunit gamma/tau [Kiloniellales bacterium]
MTQQPSETTASAGPASDTGAQVAEPYRVLARKYRPASFADLIGQDATVRTLSNAIAGGRLAHAYILTGVRGVGKTTTARIIARALNCIGPKGDGGPTAAPCGACEHCTAITEDRHVDVIEMDAASRTGIDDIRELIEGVRYRPVSARNKVYIIDEVHMLSRQAFNGLLKTLEEPPEHVVFIFATTEIRKVPVTVLSRCQRFDLRRVEEAMLVEHFARLAKSEQVQVRPAALAMIARAADGSVRDGLSLLDQAIALADGEVTEEHVKDMLGLADRARIFDLFEAVMGGQVAEALDQLADIYAAGGDPVIVLQDLLELTHFLTRARLVPEVAEDPGIPETERVRGRALADKLGIAVLARTWQMLLKGLGEARQAPSPLQAAEMVLIRLVHASELPTPGELVRRLQADAGASAPSAAAVPGAGRDVAPRGAGGDPGAPAAATEPQNVMPGSAGGQGPTASALRVAEPEMPDRAADAPLAMPASFVEVVELARARKEGILAAHLERDVHLVRFEAGNIEFRPDERAPQDLAGRLGRLLQECTGRRWMVSVSGDTGAPTLRAQRDAERAWRLETAEQDPLVREAMSRFPGARIVEVRGSAERPPPNGAADERSGSGDDDPGLDDPDEGDDAT